MQITDADILALLNGGEPKPVQKDATVSDVHVSSAEDDKVKAVVEGKQDPGEAGAAMAKRIDMLKRIDAADVVFSKGEANLYVSRPVAPASAQRLYAWALEQNIPNIVPPELMHVTVAHSTAEVDTGKITADPSILNVDVTSRWLGRLGKKGEALVLQFYDKALNDRFRQFIGAGANWDFPSYMPHITLSYDVEPPAPVKDGMPQGLDVWSMVEAPSEPLQLGPEVWQKSNDNWTKDNGLAKGDGFSLPIRVAKADYDKRMIFGWASVAAVNGVEVIDKQGDLIPVIELEKAAYEFTLNSRQHGDMHSVIGTGVLCESMMFTPEKEALGLVAKNEKGETMHGWWTGFRVDNEKTWELAKTGQLPEFSIGGKATPVDAP